MSRLVPEWGGADIQNAAKYLGFWVGPGTNVISWKEPIRKYAEKAKEWGKLGLGMLLTLQAYRVYVSSVLQFVAQLEPLPEGSDDIERGAVQSLFPGPTVWILPQCLKDAGHIHLPVALVDQHATAQASKIRVIRFENILHGGLMVQWRAAQLFRPFDDNCSLAHMNWCKNWGRHSFFFHLAEADRTFEQKLRMRQPMNINIDMREGFQRSITPLFKSFVTGAAVVHFRSRLDLWTHMSTLPEHRPDRARAVLEILRRRATPRTQAAYLRTICNGWCTKHRFQGRGACAFGCRVGQDKLEHSASCTAVRHFSLPASICTCPRGWTVFYA